MLMNNYGKLSKREYIIENEAEQRKILINVFKKELGKMTYDINAKEKSVTNYLKLRIQFGQIYLHMFIHYTKIQQK